MTLTHGQIWRAVDRLAERHGLSTSGLARRSGLDPTTFNRSKRVTVDGRARWPSTESIAKALAATGATIEDFFALLEPQSRPHGPGFAEDGSAMVGALSAARGFGEAGQAIPLIGFAQAGKGGFFDDAGFPVKAGWDEIDFPEVEDANAYALEIAGDSMAPVYREGDRVVVSPAASVRRGDRVVVKTRDGEVMAKELARRTARHVELRSLNRAHEDRQIPLEEIEWMARIVWVSQ